MGIIAGSGILAGGGGGGGGGGIPEAPSDGKTYGRRNAAWTAVETARYLHVQAAPSAVWNVQHNLGSRPVLVLTFDAAGGQVFGEPDHAGSTANQISVAFSEPLAGRAYVNTIA
jgi:hypothetical protein